MNVTSVTLAPQPVASAGATGLAVGLLLLFVLLGIIPGVIVYKWHSKRRTAQFESSRSPNNKTDKSEAAQDASHPYTSMYREQSGAQTPIYENVTRTAEHSRAAVSQSRSSREPDEDLYLQCDIAEDAIYSNDPQCDLVIFPGSREEDVYIMPDSC